MAVLRELSKYMLYLVGVQKARWDRDITKPAGQYTFYGKDNENHELDTGFFVHIRIISAVKRVVSDRISYVILRGCWCHIFILNVHAPTENKTDDVKDSFYEGLKHVFDKFPKYHTKMLLGDFDAKVGREDIVKLTIGNESLHEIANDNGVRVVNFVTLKLLNVPTSQHS
jgi:hypothetical protein